MVKPTKIYFENNTNIPIKIRPARSSKGRFEAFTLEPGGSVRSVQDSNPGSGNRDIEWDVIINPGGPDKDALASFHADNPTILNAYLACDTKGFWYANVRRPVNAYKINGKDYLTEYRHRDQILNYDRGEGFIVGKADSSRFDTYYDDDVPRSVRKATSLSYYFSQGKLDAFVPGLPFAKVEYLGDDLGQKSWNFTLENL